MGLRRDESRDRAKRVPWRRNERMSVAGREVYDWLPVFDLTGEDVVVPQRVGSCQGTRFIVLVGTFPRKRPSGQFVPVRPVLAHDASSRRRSRHCSVNTPVITRRWPPRPVISSSFSTA